MHIEHYREPERLLQACAALLDRQPAANSKIRRSVLRMVERPAAEDASAYLAVVHEGGNIDTLGVATHDSALLLAGSSRAAVRAMARDAAQWNRALRGVVGPPSLARAYADEWQDITGQVCVLRLHLCEYALAPAALLPAEAGRLRAAYPRESGVLQDWQEAFLRELRMPDDIAKARTRTAHRVERGEMWLLLDAVDAPLAMAGHADSSRAEARIAPVYTPPPLRRRGYARALVAGLCRELFACGKQAIYLAADFTDAGANALYRQIGFCAESEQYHFEFLPATAP